MTEIQAWECGCLYDERIITCFYTKTLYEHLFYAIDILGDMLSNSKIDENDLKKELRVIAEEIDMYDDSPGRYCP